MFGPKRLPLRPFSTMAQSYDCIILGGSYAGLSCALALGRARRTVLVVDAGSPRNADSKSINNLAARDGIDPRTWRSSVLRDISTKYTTVRVADASTATSARKVAEGRFEVTIEPNGDASRAETAVSRSVVLAMGVTAAFPKVLEGLPADRSRWWGSRVFHCPYCSAFENSDKPLGILMLPNATPNDAVAQAGQLSVWCPGQVHLIMDGRQWDKDGFSEAQKAALAANGVKVISAKVAAVTQDESGDIRVAFVDREPLVLHSLHLRPPTSLSSPHIVSSLGPSLRGPSLIAVDGMGKTDIKGVWAAGDCAEPKAQVNLAIAAGSNAAFGVAGDLGMADWNDGKLGGRL
ncbi:hypothetical protein DFJ74DRAFT_681967 [Hyaloraphidium curvatum]|nr:hypothetical protein DFJ74DRAFT_681967 [Hyaloraphidium curvatum]